MEKIKDFVNFKKNMHKAIKNIENKILPSKIGWLSLIHFIPVTRKNG
jgi:uncharacterized membrane protein